MMIQNDSWFAGEVATTINQNDRQRENAIIIGIIVFEALSREDSELIADAWHCDLLWGWFCHCWCVGVKSVFGYWDVLSNFMHMHFCVHMSCILYIWIGNSRYISIISGAQVSWTSYHSYLPVNPRAQGEQGPVFQRERRVPTDGRTLCGCPGVCHRPGMGTCVWVETEAFGCLSGFLQWHPPVGQDV